MLLTLFAPISADAMDALPNLRLVGAARAGQENLDVAAATERGIVMHNIMGRNAHAVSDFAIGLLFAEARNIARSHYALKNGEWRKKYYNSDFTPEITGKTLGLIGFGYIGRLVAQKLAGFKLKAAGLRPVRAGGSAARIQRDQGVPRGAVPAVRLHLPPRPADRTPRRGWSGKRSWSS